MNKARLQLMQSVEHAEKKLTDQELAKLGDDLKTRIKQWSEKQ